MSRSDIKTRSKTKQPVDKRKRENAVDKRKHNSVKVHTISKKGCLRSKTPKNMELYNSLLELEIIPKNKRNKAQKLKDGMNNNQVILDNNNLSTLETQTKKNVFSKFVVDKNFIQTIKPNKNSINGNALTTNKKNKEVIKNCNFKKSANKILRNKSKKNLQQLPVNKKDINTTNKLTKENNPKHVMVNNVACKVNNTDINTKANDSYQSKVFIISDVTIPTENRYITEKSQNSLSSVPENSLFLCDDCDARFTEKEEIEKHMYQHLKLRPFRCIHCNKKFKNNYFLSVHIIKNHLDTEKFTCDYCGQSFFIKENLSLHIMDHSKEINIYKCFCGKKFTCHFNIARHEQHHIKRCGFKCPKCKKKLMSRKSFMKHAQCHAKIKNYLCQFCGKDFKRYDSIKRHVEICHSGYRVKCPICNKNLKGHLTEHLRTHENSKPHKCPECGKTFTQATQLNVHRRRHTGAKPFECRICKHSFTHSNAMLIHFRIHTGERPYQCLLCPLTFTQSPHMKTHMLTIHGKSESYKCTKCNEFFKMKRQLQTHTNKCIIKDLPSNGKSSILSPDSAMNLSRMRFLLALLISMIASKTKLKCLGFNKRLIDDILIDALQALDYNPCKDTTITELKRLKINIQILLNGTIPKDKLQKFQKAHKTTEDVLELLTDDKTSCTKIFQCME